jgi:phage shock protein A
MGDVGLALQRAEDKVAELQSRSGAIDELVRSGALEDLTGSSDPIEAQLDRGSAGPRVEAQLAQLKRELGRGHLEALDKPESPPEGAPPGVEETT